MSGSSPPRLAYRPELDGLRGIAVLLVFVQHAQLAGFIRAGWVGVTMFFTLSGYLITALLIAEVKDTGRIDLVRFYLRRALRLLPALVALLLVVGAVAALAGRDLRLQSLATFLYVGNWADIAGLDMSVLGHTWSLGIEEQFYILWPLTLIVVPMGRWRLALCMAGIVLSIFLRLALFGPDAAAQNRWSHGLDTRADALLIGCALALGNWSAPRWAGWVGVSGILGTLLFLQTTTGLAQLGLALTAVSTALLIAARTRLTFSPLLALGGISYGVYLWHFPIIEGTRWLAADISSPLLVVGWFIATISVAVISRRLIELPALRLRNVPLNDLLRRLPWRRRLRAER